MEGKTQLNRKMLLSKEQKPEMSENTLSLRGLKLDGKDVSFQRTKIGTESKKLFLKTKT